MFAGFRPGFLLPKQTPPKISSMPSSQKASSNVLPSQLATESGMFVVTASKAIGTIPSSRSDLKPILLEARQFATISYSTTPGSVITEISYMEYSTKYNSVYSESIHGVEKSGLFPFAVFESTKKLGQEKYQDLVTKTTERLNNPLDSFVVSGMKKFGDGLFAKEDIKKDTVLFLYSGELELEEEHDEDDSNKSYIQVVVGNIVINAYKAGGLARFMQHLPREETGEYKSVVASLEKDKPGTQLQLATANVEVFQVLINGVLVNVCQAICNINKGEIIGFSYGWGFIKAQENVAYFTKTGQYLGERKDK